MVCLPGRTPRDNLRFVVTNLPHRPESIYDLYSQRGDAENRLKELHHGLELDRTSCHRFLLANQLRVLMTAAANVWIQELRSRARGTRFESAQLTTLHEQLLKVAARIEVSVRRIVVHLPRAFAAKADLLRIAACLHATPGGSRRTRCPIHSAPHASRRTRGHARAHADFDPPRPRSAPTIGSTPGLVLHNRDETSRSDRTRRRSITPCWQRFVNDPGQGAFDLSAPHQVRDRFRGLVRTNE